MFHRKLILRIKNIGKWFKQLIKNIINVISNYLSQMIGMYIDFLNEVENMLIVLTFLLLNSSEAFSNQDTFYFESWKSIEFYSFLLISKKYIIERK